LPLVSWAISVWLRLKLQLFASQQTDATVRSQCLAVNTKLAEILEGDDPILRQLLAHSVEQLEEALRWAARSTIEKATVHFSQGFAVTAFSQLKDPGDPWRFEWPAAKPPST
jgi:hypothetical protein